MIGSSPHIMLSLANVFKLRAIVKKGLPRSKVYGEKDEASRKELQIEGTEKGRKVFGEDVWIQYVHQTILNHLDRGIRLFLVTDVRFPNEVEYIRAVGGSVYRIHAPSRNLKRLRHEVMTQAAQKGEPLFDEGEIQRRMQVIAKHISETALDRFPFDPCDMIWNEPGYDAADQVRNIILRLRQSHSRVRIVFVDVDDTLCYCDVYYQQIQQAVVKRLQELTGDHSQRIPELFREHNRTARLSHMLLHDQVFRREEFAETTVKVCEKIAQAIPLPVGYDREIYTLAMTIHQQAFAEIPGAAAHVREWSEG